MARGKSGRIVLEVDPKTKRMLYLALEQNQTTLKDWFLENAKIYIINNEDNFNINSISSGTTSISTKP